MKSCVICTAGEINSGKCLMGKHWINLPQECDNEPSGSIKSGEFPD